MLDRPERKHSRGKRAGLGAQDTVGQGASLPLLLPVPEALITSLLSRN